METLFLRCVCECRRRGSEREPVLMFFTPSEWLRSPMLPPPTATPSSPLPPPLSVWIQPDIARETLPLHHHSRKSTVTEYPETPGW